MGCNTLNNEISIVDLAGALTLPLISELFAANSNLTELNTLFHRLDLLYENDRYILAFDIIYDLFRKTRLEIPCVFYEMIETSQDKRSFVGEFLTDFQEILSELSC